MPYCCPISREACNCLDMCNCLLLVVAYINSACDVSLLGYPRSCRVSLILTDGYAADAASARCLRRLHHASLDGQVQEGRGAGGGGLPRRVSHIFVSDYRAGRHPPPVGRQRFRCRGVQLSPTGPLRRRHPLRFAMRSCQSDRNPCKNQLVQSR
eukprot:scaffold54977_cov48-Prasinocladus_malaysianus.AAC.3